MASNRMSVTQRRQSILEAATRAFARTGYAGTSTATIADEARVSQPYVIQMFGSKSQLFRSVYERADQEVLRALIGALRETSALGLDPVRDVGRASSSFLDHLPDQSYIQVIVHGFLSGAKIPEVGELARSSLMELYRTVRETTGCSTRQAGNYIGHLILAGALLSVDAPGHTNDPTLADLATTVFGASLDNRLRSEAS